MQKIVTSLLIPDRIEEAVTLYTSLFPDSRVIEITHYPEGAPKPAGTVLTAVLELAGQRFILINGGSELAASYIMSQLIYCETQAEIDRLWDGLTAGGEPGPNGWLTDRFGITWQVVPTALDDLLGRADPAAAERVIQAMLGMSKLDIATLERAYRGE
jgi:predicted 3-demethylubiquinone-9 3-methyltransferase (glyoxalase superfamily)